MDTGWDRAMSPEGVFDRKAQIKSLGSIMLYWVNQGVIKKGEAINEQLIRKGVHTSELDYVLLTHLDCDHANGLPLVKDAKQIMVAEDEVKSAKKSMIRYQKQWWKDVKLNQFQWNGFEGPFQKSFDLFGDGSIQLINIPGHADGLFAVKVMNSEEKYVLLFSDGGYAKKSWSEMITSGISSDKEKQKKSLEWIREQSINGNCLESLANHDPDIKPHVIEL